MRCSLVCDSGDEVEHGRKCCKLPWSITVTHWSMCTVMSVLFTDLVNNKALPIMDKPLIRIIALMQDIIIVECQNSIYGWYRTTSQDNWSKNHTLFSPLWRISAIPFHRQLLYKDSFSKPVLITAGIVVAKDSLRGCIIFLQPSIYSAS